MPALAALAVLLAAAALAHPAAAAPRQYPRQLFADRDAAVAVGGGPGEGPQRIVGGSAVPSPSSYPFFAVITSSFLCGGSLIAPNILLTAAHCVVGTTGPSWTAVTYRLRRSQDTSQDIVYTGRTVIQHPQYNSGTMANDVALIILNPPTGANAGDGTYRPAYVQLNRNASFPAQGDTLKAIGFGTTSSGGSTSDSLLEVDLPYLTPAECRNAGYADGSADYATGMCAGRGDGRDTCQGDSGGPLFATVNGQFVQVGITSWGNGCATAAGVYSRVSALAAWIDGQVAANGGYAVVGTTTTQTTSTTRTTSTRSSSTKGPTTTSASRTSTKSQTTQTRTTTTVRPGSFCATPNAEIPDVSTVSSDIVVPAGAGTVADLDVQVAWNHTWPNDVSATLQRISNPRTASLFARPASCSTPQRYDTVFDDSAASSFACAPSASAKPAQPLSGFAGASAEGTWRLTLTDQAAQDKGVLLRWCLLFNLAPAGATTTKAPAPTTTKAPAPTTSKAPAPTTTKAPAPTTTKAPATTAVCNPTATVTVTVSAPARLKAVRTVTVTKAARTAVRTVTVTRAARTVTVTRRG